MKTLVYSLSGRHPRSIDDWADYLGKEYRRGFRSTVSVTLDHDENIEEGYSVHTFCASFSCGSECGRSALFRKIYGGFLDADGKERRIRCLSCAEKRLKHDLDALEGRGVELAVGASGFSSIASVRNAVLGPVQEQ